MSFPLITHIEAERIALRPVAATDLPALLAINGDPQVTQFLPYATWSSLDDGAAWLARMEALGATGTGQQLVVVRRADVAVIGTLLLFKHDAGSQRLELGYVLGRAHWGQGLMREALQAVCSQLFGTLGVRRIEAEVNPANVASCRLLARVGFTLEGTLRQRWVGKGITYDTQVFGCLSHEWPQGAGAITPAPG
ncbi:GNAT family N-acetyltransferase [Rhizobacter sp. AJA081-3]|uniref:GNAT family N-acetyltransferase n=1 Tax=Rhizobacter sp. AJA081-3 TaxID=2753607 RepID=UPI001ADFA770|nr:GNAT family protein [Rhizobacter sp. AJA081-3]QTN21595.1 GNAT family N-acetyltransferase [Rhizobacter sp. AJA081-3]